MIILSVFTVSFFSALLGTMIMTAGHEIEMSISRRPISHTPAVAVFKILKLDFSKLNVQMKDIASYTVHFAYGTFWGFPLAIFYFLDFTAYLPVLIIYFLIILIQGFSIMYYLGIAKWPWTWERKQIVIEIIHKAAYSIATVTIFSFFF